MLTSFAVRHEQPVKYRVGGREFRCIVCKDMFSCPPEDAAPSAPVYYSLWHESCNREVTDKHLQRLFGLPRVIEIALFRDPVDRAISAYYFWGEIGKEKETKR